MGKIGQNQLDIHLSQGKFFVGLNPNFLFVKDVCNWRGKLWKHIERCWNTMIKGQEMPDLPLEDDKTLKNVSFLEATTEALPQFTLSNIILRVYGLSDYFATMILQYFSLGSSILSLLVAFVMVSTKQLTDWMSSDVNILRVSAADVSKSNEDSWTSEIL